MTVDVEKKRSTRNHRAWVVRRRDHWDADAINIQISHSGPKDEEPDTELTDLFAKVQRAINEALGESE